MGPQKVKEGAKRSGSAAPLSAAITPLASCTMTVSGKGAKNVVGSGICLTVRPKNLEMTEAGG